MKLLRLNISEAFQFTKNNYLGIYFFDLIVFFEKIQIMVI